MGFSKKSKAPNIRALQRRQVGSSYMTHYHQVVPGGAKPPPRLPAPKSKKRSAGLSTSIGGNSGSSGAGAVSGGGGAGESMVELPIADYLALLEEQKANTSVAPPVPFFLDSMELEGSAGPDAVTFVMHLRVRVLTELGKWTSVPLLPSSMTLLAASFERDGARVNTVSSSIGGVELGGEPGRGSKDDIVYEDGVVGIQGSMYRLLTCVPGSYAVHMEMIVPFVSQRKNATKLTGLPQATQNTLTFAHPETGQSITVQPALSTSVESMSGGTTITASFPPTQTLDIQWTAMEQVVPSTPMSTLTGLSLPTKGSGSGSSSDSDSKSETTATDSLFVAPEPREAKPPVVMVDQFNLFTVAEGIMFCTSVFEYLVMHNAASKFMVEIPSNVRVLSVTGGSHVRKWEVVHASELAGSSSSSCDSDDGDELLVRGGGGGKGKGEASGDGDGEPDDVFVLVVTLKFPKENAFSLRINSEVDMHGVDGLLTMPRFVARDVVREKGYVGIASRTNVELSQVSLNGRGVTKIDTREAPGTLSGLAPQGLLLAYKFLSSDYTLVISVVKHADVGVLVAIIDEASLVVTVTEEGKLLYELTFNVRNNNRQYLRISLPEDGEVWTTTVRGSPVKPAMDAEHRIIVPIPKSESSFEVAITFLVNDEPVAERGVLRIPVPKFDLPAVLLKATLQVPPLDVLQYKDPEGDMWPVEHFDTHVGASWSSGPVGGFNDNFMLEQQMMSNVSQVAYDVNPMFGGAQQSYSVQAPSSSSNKVAGVIPMKIKPPRVGHKIYFQRLLYTTEEPVLSVSVPYRTTPTGISKFFSCC